MRIFIGLHEIADINNSLSKGFRELGNETRSVIIDHNRFYPIENYDKVINNSGARVGPQGKWRNLLQRISCQWFLVKELFCVLKNYDMVVFIYASSFLPGFIDLPILKLANKRIVSIFCGSDIRYWYAYKMEMEAHGVGKEYKAFTEELKIRPNRKRYAEQARKVRIIEKYADLILSQPDMAQLQSRPYMRLNIPLDMSRFEPSQPQREIPRIIHIPSNRGIKGTSIIIEAVSQLKREGVQFHFEMFENIPHDQVLFQLQKADIVIDQLLSHTVATFALESLASGKVVLARYRQAYSQVPAECPVVNIDQYTLVQELRRVIQDQDLRNKLASMGPDYVDKYHNHIAVANDILICCCTPNFDQYDFYPISAFTKKDLPRSIKVNERIALWASIIHKVLDFLCPGVSRSK